MGDKSTCIEFFGDKCVEEVTQTLSLDEWKDNNCGFWCFLGLCSELPKTTLAREVSMGCGKETVNYDHVRFIVESKGATEITVDASGAPCKVYVFDTRDVDKPKEPLAGVGKYGREYRTTLKDREKHSSTHKTVVSCWCDDFINISCSVRKHLDRTKCVNDIGGIWIADEDSPDPNLPEISGAMQWGVGDVAPKEVCSIQYIPAGKIKDFVYEVTCLISDKQKMKQYVSGVNQVVMEAGIGASIGAALLTTSAALSIGITVGFALLPFFIQGNSNLESVSEQERLLAEICKKVNVIYPAGTGGVNYGIPTNGVKIKTIKSWYNYKKNYPKPSQYFITEVSSWNDSDDMLGEEGACGRFEMDNGQTIR